MMPNQIDNLIQNLGDAEFMQSPRGPVAHATQTAFQAKDQLVALGTAAIPAVLNCLNGRGPAHQRAMAAQVLGDIGDRQAVSALINKLRDPEMLVRGFSAEALGKIGDRRAVAPLRAMLKNDKEDEPVKWHAQGALNRIGDVEKRSDTSKLWKWVFWLGLLIVLFGVLMAITGLTASDMREGGYGWLFALICGLPPMLLGGLAAFLATRPAKK